MVLVFLGKNNLRTTIELFFVETYCIVCIVCILYYIIKCDIYEYVSSVLCTVIVININ